MKDPDKQDLICTHCEHSVTSSDEFCPDCGSLFVDDRKCTNHPRLNAEGVCAICGLPFCAKCGREFMRKFLCNIHGGYEIIEGFARVFGTLDDAAAQYAKSCLEKTGMHPVIYSKMQPKGGPRFFRTLWAPNGGYIGHTVTEIKIVVPCQEVLKAEKTLRKLNILKTRRATGLTSRSN